MCARASAASSLGPGADLRLVPAFEHDAQQRLGARVAHQQPPVPGQRGLDLAASRRRTPAPPRRATFRATRTFTSTCGIPRVGAGEVGELLPGVGHHAQHGQRGDDAVAGEEVVREDDVPRLLAAERVAALAAITSATCLSPTGVRTMLDAGLLAGRVSRPMLLITVATTVLPRSSPWRFMCSAQSSMIASPSTTLPRWSTSRQRSPSPSNAMPRRWPPCLHGLRSGCRGASSRSPRLMLRPSGSACITVDVEARARGTAAARPSSSRRWRSRPRSSSRRRADRSGSAVRAWVM